MAKVGEQGIRISCMNPAFLNSNSTSHTWPFSAVAELVDNASDPGVSAKQMWIDVVEEKGQLCLTFTDNGCGMTPNKLHKMLSFGFTEKGSSKVSQQAIGVYGNGFKSGSMRLGRDALIFTKNGGCQSVGMMSQTYLENIKAQAVIVPIVPFNQQTNSQVMTQDSENSLKAILENSIITSVEDIEAHFDSIPSKKGTKILIWNIRRSKDGRPEMDFDTDVTDFRLPPIQIEEIKKGLSRNGSMRHEQNIPEMQYSLRAYLSILYLKPRTQIILRGKKNIPRLISKGLSNIEHDVYNPHFSKDKVKVIFGMSLTKKDHYGIMLYHKNRLIKAYEKVGCQTSGQRAGDGVIGVIECNFLKPAHNKQDFEYTKEYRLTLSALGIKLNDYWKALTEKQRRGGALQAAGTGASGEDIASGNSPTWIQCEECLKWRSVPPGHYDHVPESWSCSQNPNLRYKSCSAPEEAEEEPSGPTYQKSYKKQQFKKGRKQKSMVRREKDQSDENESLSQRFASSKQQPLNHPEDLSVSHPNDGMRASDTENMEEGSTVEADTDEDVCPRLTLVSREPPIERSTQGGPREDRGSDQGPEDEEEDVRTDTRRNTQVSSKKRKAEPLYFCVKKSFLLKQWRGTENIERTTTEKETSTREMKDRVDGDGHPSERDAFTQTSGAPPQGGTLPPDQKDQVTNLQRLAELEKEVQKIRGFLGLPVHRTTQGTMMRVQKTEDVLVTASSREIACQTDTSAFNQSSPPSCSLAQVSGDWAGIKQSALVQSAGEQPEQSRSRRKEESPSRKSSSDADSRSSQECLRLIRKNVVILLTALLPQVDLTGISMETPDVDSILQQIIEVNSLKL